MVVCKDAISRQFHSFLDILFLSFGYCINIPRSAVMGVLFRLFVYIFCYMHCGQAPTAPLAIATKVLLCFYSWWWWFSLEKTAPHWIFGPPACLKFCQKSRVPHWGFWRKTAIPIINFPWPNIKKHNYIIQARRQNYRSGGALVCSCSKMLVHHSKKMIRPLVFGVTF